MPQAISSKSLCPMESSIGHALQFPGAPASLGEKVCRDQRSAGIRVYANHTHKTNESESKPTKAFLGVKQCHKNKRRREPHRVQLLRKTFWRPYTSTAPFAKPSICSPRPASSSAMALQRAERRKRSFDPRSQRLALALFSPARRQRGGTDVRRMWLWCHSSTLLQLVFCEEGTVQKGVSGLNPRAHPARPVRCSARACTAAASAATSGSSSLPSEGHGTCGRSRCWPLHQGRSGEVEI